MTITLLTIRQFMRSRAMLVVAAISLFPIIFALIPQLLPDGPSLRDQRRILGDVIFLGFLSTTLLPLATLVLSTSALGDEVEDKTLQYLALKPITRTRIVLGKFLAVMLVTVPIVWIGVLLTWAVGSWGAYDAMRDMLWPMLAATLVGMLGFGSVFLLLSLLIPRALLFGVFYVFIWESALSRFLPGIRSISISHYTRSMFVRLLDDRRITIDGPSATQTIIVTIACVMVISLALAIWRLRSMSLE
ncbi:MAG TPA: ABC transporter permease subunit [Thermomicrobiales bacterium]|nr:ABC transporter permease subunit [Thermomicrobiales bacterium]